jgi:hypothetical protein
VFSYRTIAIALIIPALSASTLIYAAKRSVPIGAVVAWSGDVFVYHQDEDVGVTVSGIEGVFTNDLIVTTGEARAKILLNDDSVLSVGEESRFEIKEFSLEEEKRKRFAHLKLLKGKLRALVARRFSGKGSKFQVETRTATQGALHLPCPVWFCWRVGPALQCVTCGPSKNRQACPRSR